MQASTKAPPLAYEQHVAERSKRPTTSKKCAYAFKNAMLDHQRSQPDSRPPLLHMPSFTPRGSTKPAHATRTQGQRSPLPHMHCIVAVLFGLGCCPLHEEACDLLGAGGLLGHGRLLGLRRALLLRRRAVVPQLLLLLRRGLGGGPGPRSCVLAAWPGQGTCRCPLASQSVNQPFGVLLRGAVLPPSTCNDLRMWLHMKSGGRAAEAAERPRPRRCP